MNSSLIFPRRVSYMWKTATYSSLPTDTLSKWVSSCKSLNEHQYDFHLYDDDYLKNFVAKHYQEYFPLFRYLSGVYMADMARVLIAYHYGGIYMDLDFYCYKKFICLEGYVEKKLQERYSVSYRPKDILVVSNEPSVHAWLFKNKSRVIIQDFFMATPKHPFFKYILDDRMQKFYNNGNTTVKGPFSYHIHKDIDAYRALHDHSNSNHNRSLQSMRRRRTKRQRKISTTSEDIHPILSSSSVETKKTVPPPVILELSEDILHPLIDSTNHKLYDRCPSPSIFSPNFYWNSVKAVFVSSDIGHATSKKISCEIVQRREFLRPSVDTVLVHMWTHVYLGWNFVRKAYNSNIYALVASTLPQQDHC
mmetsp:Transcript_28625/g.40799  ORF Transcript_28625/g.40799 Transcript_28625/m.40799 type:complete len:363 (-) Transcript_28625:36-1124(-)